MPVLPSHRVRLADPNRLIGWSLFVAGMAALAATVLSGPAAAVAAVPTVVLPAAPPLPPAAGPVDAPGVAVTFFPAGREDDPAAADTRAARMIALHVPAAAGPSPFVAAPNFVAVFDGAIVLRLRDTYAFAAEGRGKVAVTVNGKPALAAEGDDLSKAPPAAAVRLNKGKNAVRVRYEPPAGKSGGAGGGDATFRLLWVPKGEPFPEPIPPTALVHDAAAPAAAAGERVRAGRQLFADLRCAKCHTVPELAGTLGSGGGGDAARTPTTAGTLGFPRAAMPELGADAPDLAAVGGRLNRDWMAAWINDPRAFRANPHMPRVFAPSGGRGGGGGSGSGAIDPRAADVAAYLATLGGGHRGPVGGGGTPGAAPPVPAPADPATVARGGQLFTHLNCVVCHEPPGWGGAAAAEGNPKADSPRAASQADGPAPLVGDAASGNAVAGDAGRGAGSERVPLKHVAAKFRPGALASFLLNPSAHYAWIGMPNFRFAPDEANAVAAFLLTEAKAAAATPAAAVVPVAAPAGDPARGKALVASSGCLNCHHVADDAKPSFAAPALAAIAPDAWARGCMAADAAGHRSTPDFHLSDRERAALLAFAATDRTSLYRDAPAEFAARQIRTLNCAGCHARDGRESLLATTYAAEQQALEARFPAPKGGHAEAFAPDQRAPLMTWFGEKLRPQWAAAFVGGEVKAKPRPYLHARMPAFASRAAGLANGLAAEHGVSPAEPPNPPPDAARAAVGRGLAGKAPNASFGCVQCHAVAAAPPLAPFEAPAVNFALAADRLRGDYYRRWVHNPLKLDPNTKMPAFERDDGTTPVAAVLGGDARRQFDAIWQYLLAGEKIVPPAD